MSFTECTSSDLLNEETDEDKDNRSRPFKSDTELTKSEQELQLVKDEWDAVTTVIPGLGIPNSVCLEGPKQSDLISFNEALQFFQTFDMSSCKNSKKIVPVISRSGFSVLLHCLCGPPKLSRDLAEERDLIFTIAAYFEDTNVNQARFLYFVRRTAPLDDSLPIHMRVLQTIYRQLTGDRFDCPRYGRHWELIGFQGSDPATDLRGAGFWGLMNLLYFVTCPQTLSLARSVYRLSLHEVQNFPFVVMSINVTAIVLQVLREEKLNRVCNGRKQVVAVVNDFYVGVFLHLYLRWKNENKTISHSGFVLKDVENHAKKHPKTILSDLEDYSNSEKEPSARNRRSSIVDDVPRIIPATTMTSIADLYDVFPNGDGHIVNPAVDGASRTTSHVEVQNQTERETSEGELFI